MASARKTARLYAEVRAEFSAACQEMTALGEAGFTGSFEEKELGRELRERAARLLANLWMHD